MPNLLAHSASPYLRQHAENPVDWMPWGEDAFARARRERKPIFLSIGYATCHWCHVMAHESFEDTSVAELLNQHFIPVKVDREERPDVDKVYMTYVQSVTGRGGWPLSVFLTPDLKPFFGGTYFPVEDTQSRPGFMSLLGAILQAWDQQGAQLEEEGQRVVESLAEHFSTETGHSPEETDAGAWLEEAWPAVFGYFDEHFDQTQGGFGGAPKFPQPGNLSFLLRYAAAAQEAEGASRALNMVTQTLSAMARGGIHDHVGGGFHRYSVDGAWFVPHFEKMLYDQAQIAAVAVEAWQATGDSRLAWVARDTLEYVLRDLAHPEGGFYGAEDADSPVSRFPGAVSREGAFYLWNLGDLREALGSDAEIVAAHFGVTETGNVPPELDPHGEMSGGNILAQTASLQDTAARLGLPPVQVSTVLARSLVALRGRRSGRARPLRDGKIVTAWNGLMLSALAKAAAAPAPVLREAWERTGGAGVLVEAALRCVNFLKTQLWDEASGRLLRSQCEGVPGPEAVAEDYACLIAGLLDLQEVVPDPALLAWALRLQTRMDALFLDENGGGYFNSRADAPDLVLRLKEDYDGAEPAPSSVAVSNLLRLAALFRDEKLRVRALRTVAGFRVRWSRSPQAMPVLVTALERCLMWPPLEVVVTGALADPARLALLDVLAERPGQPRVVINLASGCDHSLLLKARPELAELDLSTASLRVCVEGRCQAPVTEPEALRRVLAGL